ncbi:MAG: hypothetical protein GX616_02905 [Planctomycetes bacterium]|nr:hypothetical protein [Planctomycetota bacterium]
MTEINDQSPDHLERRCRLLGHEIRFGYCRLLPEGRPCRLIVECWQGSFDVVSYLKQHYTDEQIEGFLAPPKPKLVSLLELIEKAKQAAGDSESECGSPSEPTN